MYEFDVVVVMKFAPCGDDYSIYKHLHLTTCFVFPASFSDNNKNED